MIIIKMELKVKIVILIGSLYRQKTFASWNLKNLDNTKKEELHTAYKEVDTHKS